MRQQLSKDGRNSKALRAKVLEALFQEFDTNNNGTIGRQELFQLGVARRERSQKKLPWTEAMNDRMLLAMKKNRDDGDREGEVRLEEFVAYFEAALPHLTQP